jgi:hypothetical protein
MRPGSGDLTPDRRAPSAGPDLELVWPGKYFADGSRRRPGRGVERLRVIERFPEPTGEAPSRLVVGDNLRTLPALLERFAGRVDLVYLDPPFGTGDAFHVRAPRQATSGGHTAIEGQPGPADPSRRGVAAYSDRVPGRLGGFIAMLAPQLELIRDLLAPTGSLYLHLDAHSVHAAKLLCDEIFGAASFRNHLAWVYAGRELSRRHYNAKHDDILFYTRGRSWTFHPERILEPLRESSRRALSRHVDEDGVPYVIRYRDGGGFAQQDEPGRTYRQPLPAGGLPRDWFTADYARKSERTGYPTQKPEALVARFVAASSEPGDLVADLFAGSGTTAVVAARLGRRWLAADASPAAIATTRRRLLGQPDAGGGFEVQALAAALPPVAPLNLTVRRLGDARSGPARRARLDGPENDLAAVVAWAIGSRESAEEPFVASAAAARDPWAGDLALELPADPALPDARAWTATGAALDIVVSD